jgi:hypothetical protein
MSAVAIPTVDGARADDGPSPIVLMMKGFPSVSVRRGFHFGVVLLGLLVLGVWVRTPYALADPITHVWLMDEPNGSGTMLDSGLPTPVNGTWENIQSGFPGAHYNPTSNPTDTAYLFDGSDSRVIVNDDASLDPRASGFTVTAWVNFTGVPTADIGGDYDLARKGLASTSGGYWKIETAPNSTGTKVLGLCQMKGSVGRAKIKKAPYTLNDGRWHMISCTKTDTWISLTVDAKTYFKTVTIGSIANAAPLTVGAKPGSGGDWYNGFMDDVSLQIGA